MYSRLATASRAEFRRVWRVHGFCRHCGTAFPPPTRDGFPDIVKFHPVAQADYMSVLEKASGEIIAAIKD
jgi:hypothetical protein